MIDDTKYDEIIKLVNYCQARTLPCILISMDQTNEENKTDILNISFATNSTYEAKGMLEEVTTYSFTPQDDIDSIFNGDEEDE